jgi:hypothetical protein
MAAWPANRVRIARLYQARCQWCPWKGTIAEHPNGRNIANNEKRLHVEWHRLQDAARELLIKNGDPDPAPGAIQEAARELAQIARA